MRDLSVAAGAAEEQYPASLRPAVGSRECLQRPRLAERPTVGRGERQCVLGIGDQARCLELPELPACIGCATVYRSRPDSQQRVVWQRLRKRRLDENRRLLTVGAGGRPVRDPRRRHRRLNGIAQRSQGATPGAWRPGRLPESCGGPLPRHPVPTGPVSDSARCLRSISASSAVRTCPSRRAPPPSVWRSATRRRTARRARARHRW